MTSSEERRSLAWLRGVMDRYEGPLVRYAWRITHDLERARDVVQDTFLRLWDSGRGEQQDHLPEWLFTVCRNRAIDVRRKERRMTLTDQDPHAHLPDGVAGPADTVETSETAGKAIEALGELPSRQQEVLMLKFQNGFSYREIAGITGLSTSNVGYLIHEGIAKLRRKFKTLGLLDRA